MKTMEITYADFLKKNAVENSDSIALCSDKKKYTYAELDKITDAFAAELVKNGLKKNDHIALWSYNSSQWVISFLSILKAGGIAVLMNYSLPYQELAELVSFTDSIFLLYGNNRPLSKDPDSAIKLAKISKIDEKKLININEIDFKSYLKKDIDASKIIENKKNDDPHRTAVIIFTTGTTAMPKAVQLSQFSIINDALGYGDMFTKRMGNSLCNTLPLFHSFGLMVATLYLLKARAVYLHELIKADVIINTIDEYKTSDLSGVGAVYSSLIEHPEFDIKIIPNVRLCLIGGSVSTPVFMMRLEEKFSHAVFLNGYGQTEASPAISQSSPEDSIEKRASSVGKPLHGCQVRIWSKEKGFLKSGETGEIVAKGYLLMNGYYKLPKEKQSIDSDGWLHTGDLGFLDEENYLHITDRIKDIIIKNGENISPAEIEKKIIENPSIKEVKVMGAPHPVTGESIEACVVLNSGRTIDEKSFADELRLKISKFKIPSHFFVFEEFPCLGNGKLDQKSLKTEMLRRLSAISAKEKLENGFCISKLEILSAKINVSPASVAISEILKEMKFSAERQSKILESTRAVLNDRIHNPLFDVGTITIKVILLSEKLRLEFSDDGERYFSERNNSAGTAKILLNAVDGFNIVTDEKGKSSYCLDFIYEQKFNANDFLCENVRDLILI